MSCCIKFLLVALVGEKVPKKGWGFVKIKKEVSAAYQLPT